MFRIIGAETLNKIYDLDQCLPTFRINKRFLCVKIYIETFEKFCLIIRDLNGFKIWELNLAYLEPDRIIVFDLLTGLSNIVEYNVEYLEDL